MIRSICLLAVLCALSPVLSHAADAPPIRVLLITGGGYHDYAAQKDILKAGIESRIHAVVDQVHVDDTSSRPRLPIYDRPDYARGYDVVIHAECAGGIDDPAVIATVLQPHRDGIPGVNLHCAMHSYRFGDYHQPVADGAANAVWYEYVGLQSTFHGPQEPIAVHYLKTDDPVTRGLADWTTGKEELYNNIRLLPGIVPLARGVQRVEGRDVDAIVAWTHLYRGTRVFSTTLAHNNATVADPHYLDLVARGILWAVGKLDVSGAPLPGYGPDKAAD